MPIYAPQETLEALGDWPLKKCDSRSLFKDRLADPQASDKTTPSRKDWFNSLIGRKAEPPTTTPWLPPAAVTLHARLMSRLMVDLAGGVMENANVHLDRCGLPIIPGSAVKGCARRMALQALHDWIETGTERPSGDDACAPCCEGFAQPVAMLVAIARIFGWTPEDWKTDKKDGRFKSDFAWAAHGDKDLLQAAQSPNPAFATFAGSIAFLAASPNRDPGLELDVLTPHHTKYYQGELQTATDTEDPVPVFFPAVKSQEDSDGYFTFPLIPLRPAANGDLDHANRWLAHGLALLGLGAKNNAGYGWFSIIPADEFQQAEEKRQTAASDYKDQQSFENTVLRRLNKPQEYQLLQREIEKLKKPENASWLEKLKQALTDPSAKDARKRLKEKEWFPKEWLPNP